MFRRNARIRQEFFYRKAQEKKQAAIAAKKKQVKNSLEENKEFATSIRKDAVRFEESLEWDVNVGGVTFDIPKCTENE